MYHHNEQHRFQRTRRQHFLSLSRWSFLRPLQGRGRHRVMSRGLGKLLHPTIMRLGRQGGPPAIQVYSLRLCHLGTLPRASLSVSPVRAQRGRLRLLHHTQRRLLFIRALAPELRLCQGRQSMLISSHRRVREAYIFGPRPIGRHGRLEAPARRRRPSREPRAPRDCSTEQLQRPTTPLRRSGGRCPRVIVRAALIRASRLWTSGVIMIRSTCSKHWRT